MVRVVVGRRGEDDGSTAMEQANLGIEDGCDARMCGDWRVAVR